MPVILSLVFMLAYFFCVGVVALLPIDCLTRAPASKDTPDFNVVVSDFVLLLWLLNMLLGSDMGDTFGFDGVSMESSLSTCSKQTTDSFKKIIFKPALHPSPKFLVFSPWFSAWTWFLRLECLAFWFLVFRSWVNFYQSEYRCQKSSTKKHNLWKIVCFRVGF